MRIILLSIMLVLVFFSSNAAALERFDIVTTEEMQGMLEKRKAGALDFVLVNCLDEMIFRNSHIPGSVNVPLSEIEKNVHKLGVDRSKLIVPY